MAKSLPKEWNFEEVTILTNVIEYPPNIPHICPSCLLAEVAFCSMSCFQNFMYLDNLVLINFSFSIDLNTLLPQIGRYGTRFDSNRELL
jgi:hypothetical protein